MIEELGQIVAEQQLSRQDLVRILSCGADQAPLLKEAANQVMRRHVGDLVYYRGIIEFSNICTMDCCYCGIRRSNVLDVPRYRLSREQITETAIWCADQGYGSVVLQSGERQDEEFIAFTESVIRTIKQRTVSDRLPAGLGITLGIGQQSPQTYERLYRAGAHRYLLRIETTDEELFGRIHPPAQTLSSRIACLQSLREIGYQVGTGVMIGLPGQTLEMLADDIAFFAEQDIDMIGMGPYIVHPDSAMAELGMMERGPLLQLSLNMIAAVRLALKDVNIAATTALQAIAPDGREQGLSYGANVTMPNLTPVEVRKGYQLYAGKPCLEESSQDCSTCLLRRIQSLGRDVGFDQWGDSPHATAAGRIPGQQENCRSAGGS